MTSANNELQITVVHIYAYTFKKVKSVVILFIRQYSMINKLIYFLYVK